MTINLRTRCGFTLIELLIALALAATVITGMLQLSLAVNRSYQLQQNLGAMQEDARFALQHLTREIEQAGFHPEPRAGGIPFAAIGADAVDSLTASGDRVVIRRWSDRNCHDNENPVTDATGRPMFYLLESGFTVNAAGDLAQRCRYGPDSGNLTVQINGLGLIQNVEAWQVLYAEDSDGDGQADRWTKAGEWSDEAAVLGIRVAILLRSPGRLTGDQYGNMRVLDSVIRTPADGRLRRVFQSTIAIKGRAA